MAINVGPRFSSLYEANILWMALYTVLTSFSNFTSKEWLAWGKESSSVPFVTLKYNQIMCH